MPPGVAATRQMRLFTRLTAVGGLLVIAGLATGVVGGAARLSGGRDWQPVLLAAAVLLLAGLACGAALVALAVGWHLSIRAQQLWPDRHAAPPVAAAPPASRAVPRGPQLAMRAHAARLAARLTRRWRAEPAGPSGGAALQRRRRGIHRATVPRIRGPRGSPRRTDPEAALALAQQKMDQIKDLYREAEQLEDAELNARWEDLRRRQQELIRQYFEQSGLGGKRTRRTAT